MHCEWSSAATPPPTPPPAVVDCFEVLGCPRDATSHDLKRAFFARAKRLHPDTTCAGDDDELLHVRFVALNNAYDTLKDPERRRQHAMELDEVERRRTEFDDEWIRKNRHKATRRRRHTSSSSSFVPVRPQRSYIEKVQAEFDSAMGMAFQGPQFDDLNDPRQFPLQFETEVRNVLSHQDILQLVSGRQLLGAVRAVGNKELSFGPDLLNPSSESAQQLENIPHAPPGPSSARQPERPPPTNQPTTPTTTLQLFRRCSDHREEEVVAFATREYDTADSGKDVISVFCSEGSLLARVKGLRQAHGKRFSTVDVSTTGPSGEKKTHTLLCFKTPGVQFLHWWHDDGLLECRCSRAWLPDSRLWMFRPRSSHHDRGGWYYEAAAAETGRTTPVPVFVLVSAFKTLDLEELSADQAPTQWRWTSSPTD